ncbi:oxidoreductase, partial [Bordetella pertussis]
YNLLNLHSYQAGLAEQVRRRTGMPVRAVGGIADPRQAQAIIETGQADQVALARAFLADPRWVGPSAPASGLVHGRGAPPAMGGQGVAQVA